jgi:hypothetical protein
MDYEALIESIEISSNSIASSIFTTVSTDIITMSLIIIMILYFAVLALGLLKNI